ncbi:hypothetical protein ISN45_At04g006610 [Arabidopsis thaliana x Arabidopsis arenosa]|uniref:Arabidopsis retrotransposon Orf1 C-terminal domain-containing protein n=1 Tax=Arabidopsis thaliana x Arabidopsis arenosa TaxID=1240361 RepID=A0A8T2DYN1_9BRAS|nr:hypothetical protein ISN45_At04g006610 [Arabidopsis thaliana x Arabidopsis arenosa]
MKLGGESFTCSLPKKWRGDGCHSTAPSALAPRLSRLRLQGWLLEPLGTASEVSTQVGFKAGGANFVAAEIPPPDEQEEEQAPKRKKRVRTPKGGDSPPPAWEEPIDLVFAELDLGGRTESSPPISMDSRRKSSSRGRRSSVDNEEVEAFDMSGMTERQICQDRCAQRSSLILGGSSSRSAMLKEEVARGKRVVEVEEVHRPVGKRNRPRRKREPTPSEYYQYLKELKFELGICGDVEYLMELANLATFMTCQWGGFKEESCQLLSTLKVHFCVDDSEKEERGGLGYINFKVGGVELDISHLDTIFGFPSGERIRQDYDQDEIKSLWTTIAGPKPYSPAKSKSSSIRSLVIRYLHQCIAITLFPKKTTRFVYEGELFMIAQALVFILRETEDGRKMAGDRVDTSLTVVLLDHLLSYREYVATIHLSGICGSLCVGGLLTPILGASRIQFGTPDVFPKFIDLNYLKGKDFLEKKTPADHYIFKFNHPKLGPSLLPLPCENRTSLKTRHNINFMPSPSSLNIDIEGAREDEQEYTQADYEQQEYYTQADYEQQVEFEQLSEQPEQETKEFKQAHYEADADQGGDEITEVYKKLRVLEELGNLHSKTMKGFKKKMRTMKKSLKSMANQIKDFQSKPRPPSPTPEVRRSGSTSSAARRAERIDQPRASSLEPREVISELREPRSRQRRGSTRSTNYSTRQNEQNPPASTSAPSSIL